MSTDQSVAGAIYEPLRNGTSVFKISSGGKPAKRHLYVTPDLRLLRWLPSRRKDDSDFVSIGDIPRLAPGLTGARFEKYGDAGSRPIVSAFLAERCAAELSVERMAGQLDKMGGAYGGRKTWAARWFVLIGCRLAYYAGPGETAARKDSWDLSGCYCLPGEDPLSFKLEWVDESQPARELRAYTPEDRDRWVFAIRKALRLQLARSGSKPLSAMAAVKTGAGKAVAASVEPTEDRADDDVRVVAAGLAALGPVDESAMSCSIIPTDAKETVAFVFPSIQAYDLWYSGLWRARCYQRHMKVADKKLAFVEHLEIYDNDNVVRVLLGETLEELGDKDGALAHYLRASQLQPRLPSARKNAGRLLLQHKKDHMAALEHLEATAALYERDDFMLMIWLGQARMLAGRYKSALSAFVFAITIDPKTTPLHTLAATVGCGDALLSLGRPDDALTRFKAAIKIDNRDAALHRKIAQLLTQGGKTEEAATHLEEIRRIELANAPYHELQAKELSSRQQFLEALPHWDVVARAFSDDLSRMLAAAEAYYMAEQNYASSRRGSADATALDMEGMKISDEGSAAVVDIDHSKLSRFDLLFRAEELLIKVLTDDAASPEGNILCGKLYDRLAKLELADMEQSLKAAGSPIDAAADETAVSGWTPNQRWQRVESFYSYVVSAYPEPTYVEAAVLISELYKRQGRYDEAQANLEIALERDPDNKAALDLLARVNRLKEGNDEYAPISTRKPAKAGGGDVDFVDGVVPGVEFSADMSKEERDKAFFNAMAEEKRKKKEEEKRKEEAKLASMTPEERVKYEAEQDEKSKHDAKKDKVLKNHLGMYGQTSLALRGRGRGRGK